MPLQLLSFIRQGVVRRLGSQANAAFSASGLVEFSGFAHPPHDPQQLGLYHFPDFITPDEEAGLLRELDRPLQRSRYDSYHWDNAITNYREMHRTRWSPSNTVTLQRLRDLPLLKPFQLSPTAHVLDVDAEGEILPHVDSTQYVGRVVVGLSLMSSSVMQFQRQDGATVRVLLHPRSLYIMSGSIRYDFTHAVLRGEQPWQGGSVRKGRRISILVREEAPSLDGT
eukprot:m.91065 g.91065  ORF g.91065 m.91065 type:complete len:225 (-) comp18199_c0_seq1:31-705(-)